MIKLTDFSSFMKKIGIPFAYHDFRSNKGDMPEYPYCMWYCSGSDNFGADNVTFAEMPTVIIELYTEVKDLAAEKRIKSALTSAGLYYDTTESDLEEDSVHIVYFTVPLMG